MNGAELLDELSLHLQEIDENPATPFDVQLLEKCELFTSTSDYLSSKWKDTQPLFLQIASLLPKLQQDPAPLTHFIIKLATPYRFDDIKDVDFEIGLALEAQAVHGLILSLLEKATGSSNDAQVLANRPSVIYGIVRLWLCTQDTAIATQAASLLTSLLRVSRNEPVPATGDAKLSHYGTAPIWKRLFKDRDIYTLYYLYTSLAKLTIPGEPSLSKRDKTIAQARLLEWLPQVGNLDWETITSSHVPEIEKEVGLAEHQGLLHYASLKMVDTADDILMHLTLINFFSDLITTVKISPHLTHNDSSLSLDFLKEHGIHKDIIDFHTGDSSSIEHSFLSPRSAHYIAQYASTYPENFESSPELEIIRQYLSRNIRQCEPTDLSIVAAMPRTTLIPRTPSGLFWDSCLLLGIPITRTNPDALKTLATVFHGPPREELTFPASAADSNDSAHTANEQIFARLLTSLFYTKNPNLFSALVSHAETIAMKDNAIAALSVLRALITSNWSSAPPSHISQTDSTYQRLQSFPATGLAAILDPAISGGVLPYLMKPATTFSNTVGGGSADNAPYQVAMAKFDVLKALEEGLKREGGRHEVVSMVQRRVAQGPWGVSGGAGSRIATVEM